MKAQRAKRITSIVVTVGALVGTGCESKGPAPEPKQEKEAAPAPTASASGETNPAAGAMFGRGRNSPQPGTVQIEQIWVVNAGGNPFGGIVPCTLVIKGIWNASQHTAFELDYTLNYRSGGKMVSQRFTMPLKNMHFMMDHPTMKQFVRLDTVFNVSARPVDPGTAVTGTVQLMHAAKGVRAAAGESVNFDLNLSKGPPAGGK